MSTKIQKMKAIHNFRGFNHLPYKVVSMSTKIQKMKAIHNEIENAAGFRKL